MADLRDLFEALGFRDVRTVLNSGNVVSSPATTHQPLEARRFIARIVSRSSSSTLG